MAESGAAVAARSLTFRYPSAPRAALNHIDLSIFPGEYVAVLGANGSGKSTFLKCVCGLLEPDFGSVEVSGGADPTRFKRSVAVVLQNPDDQIVGTVAEEDVAFGPINAGFDRPEVEARVSAALRFVGLEAARRKPPHFLSGGERQRLALAGALALDAPILALDEAASMLDPTARDSLMELLDRLSAEGKTILHVTHSMEEASCARRVVVLSEGRVVFDGVPARLFERPELEAWGLGLPQALLCARAIALRGASFTPTRLDPAGFAAELAARLSSEPLLPAACAERRRVARAPEVLRFESLSHTYLRGTAFAASAVRNASLSLAKGSSLALVGSSGSGKSTLLRHGNAVLLPQEGRAVVLGSDTLDPSVALRPLRLRAALSVQSPESALFSRYAADDVAYGPRNKGLSGKALVRVVKEAMDHSGLPYQSYRDREISSLSGGEKRKAALAGVFALDAELYLLDEPSAALDPVSRGLLLDRVLLLPASGSSVAATTHSMDEAARFDRVAVMKDGSLVAEGCPEELFYEGYDPSWGIGLPWAVAAARALASLGVPVRGRPLDVLSLASSIGPGPEAEQVQEAESAGSTQPWAASDGSVRGGASSSPAGARRPRRRRRGVGIEFFRNAVFGQFLDRPSPVADLPPVAKYLGLAALFLCALAVPGPAGPLASLSLACLIGAAARVWPRHLLRGALPALPYLALVVAFQLAFSWPGDRSAALLRWGPFDVTAAEIGRSALLVLRFAALVAALSLFSAVTPLSQAVEGLDRLLSPLGRIGLPVRDFSMIAAVALRFVPVLVEEAERIAVAQLSRGGGYAGKGKVRAGLALTVPLFLRSLERAETLATAMELRLYGSRRP